MLKAAVIGCGGIGRRHANGYKKNGIDVVAVADSNEAAARSLADELGSIKCFADYRMLIDEVKPDIVSVCTPPVAHEEMAVYALGRDVNVLCEKPLAFDIAAAHRMRAAAAKSKAIVMPAFRHRFLPAIRTLRELVQSGKIGDIVFFNNTFCGPAFAMEDKWFTRKAIAGGGSILDTNSHSVDLFRFIVGEVVEQNAIMHRHFRKTDVEDAGSLQVKAAGGALGTLQSAFVAGVGMAVIDIMGTKGRAIFDYTDRIKFILNGEKDWQEKAVEVSDGIAEEIASLSAFLEKGTPLECTLEDGVRAMEIIGSVYD